MAHDEDVLRSRIAQLQGAPERLLLGMTLTAGEYVLADPLAIYLNEHPDTELKLHSDDTRALLALLDDGAIDCAFVEGFFDKSTYSWSTWSKEKLVLVCAPNHIFEKEIKSINDLFAERLFVREEGSGTRAVLEHSLADENLALTSFERVSMVKSLNIIKKLVAGDAGISFLYESVVKREIKEGVLCEVPLNRPPMEHDITFIRLKGSAFETDYQRFFAEMSVLA